MSDTAPAIDPAHEAEPAPAAPRSSLGRMLRLARKELSEVLRDRRTVVTLVAMPLLLYPLLSVAFQQFFLASRANPEGGPTYRIGVSSKQEHYVLTKRLQRGYEALREQNPTVNGKEPTLPQIELNIASPEQLDEELHTGRIDLILRVPELTRMRGLPSPRWDWDFDAEASYRPEAPGALGALTLIERWLAAGYEEDLRDRLNRPGPGPRTVLLRLRRQPLEEAGSAMVSLASLVPLILILMTVTGAVYPAIDLTAGERERGTLEVLMAAPVPRFALLTAKYLAVLAVAVLTALVNLASMTVTLLWSGLGGVLFGPAGLSPLLLVELLLLLLLFAAFFSAVLLCLTSFARSFKEAQAYLIPLMLASLAPGILALMPGLRLGGVLAVAPLVNIVLLARDLIQSTTDPSVTVHPALAVLVVLTTLLYALAALSLAARVFGAESVLYSEQSGWADLLRRPEAPTAAASVPAALWCLALAVPIQFAARAALASLGAPAPVVALSFAAALSALLFVGLPLLFATLGRVVPRTGFALIAPRPAALAAGLLLGCSLWPLVLRLLALQTLPEAFRTQAEGAAEALRQAGVLAAAALALSGACEEFFFRGFLFQALRRVAGYSVTVGVSAVLFGLAHAVQGGAVGLGQLLPGMFMGLVLGTVCWVSRSVWPGVLLHACHNALLVLAPQSGLISPEEITWPWLAAAGTAATLGAMCLLRGRRD